MLVFTILYLLFGLNLMQLMSDKSTVIYKDVRFWLVIVSLCVLVGMTIQSYPG